MKHFDQPVIQREAPLHSRAVENLTYIRSAMEKSARFTAIPGVGAIFVGVIGISAAVLANRQETEAAWLTTWLIAAAVAFVGAVIAAEGKAQRMGLSLASGPGRKFLMGFLPSVVAGVALTAVLARAELWDLLPGVWLLLYGVGIIAAGSASIPIVPISGLLYLLLGVATLVSPPGMGDILMAMGFGVLHLFFGVIIYRRYGG